MLCFGMPTLIELPELRRSAALCRRLGLRFIELNMSFPHNQLARLDERELRAVQEEYGIFYTIHIDESMDPCHVNPRIAGVYREDMCRTVALARRLHIPTLNMHLLRGVYVTLPDRRVYIYDENEAFFLEGLRAFRDEMSEAAGEDGPLLCVENTDGFDRPFLLHGLDLLLESPAFGLTFDIGHDHAIDGRDEPLLLARGERLHHMHMHDGLGRDVHLALGDGEMDLPRFLRLAEEHSCRVVLETKTVAALERSVAWLRERGYL